MSIDKDYDEYCEQPTKTFGPNLVGVLNSAGFYKKAEWVGLTIDDIESISVTTKTTDIYNYFRAIEERVKEKNT